MVLKPKRRLMQRSYAMGVGGRKYRNYDFQRWISTLPIIVAAIAMSIYKNSLSIGLTSTRADTFSQLNINSRGMVKSNLLAER
jgi:hypothetical protein